MSKANLCDICEKPITAKRDFLRDISYEQYKVKIKHIKKGSCLGTHYYDEKECLDVCLTCMNKFVEFANKERKV